VDSSIDLNGGQLAGADLAGKDLSGANLRGAYLWRADLSCADLSSADLSNADLRLTDLSSTNLSNANLSGADLHSANLSNANLSGAYLHSANLTGANLSTADLAGKDLSGAYLSGAYLSGADLSNADLSNADLSNADLSNADLSNADLSGADLHYASLSGADLGGADLFSAQLGGVTSGNAVSAANGPPTSLPTRWKLVKGYLVGPEARLTGADLSEADLSGMDLSGANLLDADLSGADLSGAKLRGTNFYLEDLEGAISHNADLSIAHIVPRSSTSPKFKMPAAGSGGTFLGVIVLSLIPIGICWLVIRWTGVWWSLLVIPAATALGVYAVSKVKRGLRFIAAVFVLGAFLYMFSSIFPNWQTPRETPSVNTPTTNPDQGYQDCLAAALSYDYTTIAANTGESVEDLRAFGVKVCSDVSTIP